MIASPNVRSLPPRSDARPALFAIFHLMPERRAFLFLACCEIVRGFVKVPSYALGLSWLTEGCLRYDGSLTLLGFSILSGAALISTVVVVLTEYHSLRITARTKSEIRARLINSALVSDPDQADSGPEMIYTLNNSVNDLAQLYRATSSFIGSFGKILGSLVTGFWLSVPLSLLVLSLGLVKIGLDKTLLSRLQAIMTQIKQAEPHLVKEVVEHLEGTVFFRIFGNEERSLAHFAQLDQRFTAANMEAARVGASVNAVTKGFEFLTLLAILAMGGLAVVRGEMAMGALTAFMLIYDDLINPYRFIGDFLKHNRSLSVSYDRVAAALSRTPATVQVDGVNLEPNAAVSLVVEGVSFGYSQDRQILEELSFEAPAGELTYVVGRSGAGKTTLFKLLMGFCAPQQGRVGILVEGLGLIAPRPEFFTYVSQDPFLFSGTIRENIALQEGIVDEWRLTEAIRKAGIADLISELPEGLDTLLSDGGTQLSGGQRCRIALARVFYRETPVVLLDEVFAALDNNTIGLVKRSIDELCCANRCVLMISHRHEWIDPGARVVEIGRYSAE